MNRPKNILIIGLIFMTILSLAFGFWGMYQAGRMDGLKGEVLKTAPQVNQEPADDSHYYSFDDRYEHRWFWPAGVGRIICWIMFFFCVLGFGFRFLFGWGPWHWSCCDDWRGCQRWYGYDRCKSQNAKIPE